MLSTDQIERLLSDGTVVSRTGEKIGKVGQVYLDDSSGKPEWVTVRTGLFGTGESFVPLGDADVEGDDEGHLSPEEEAELYRYYGRLSPGSGSGPERSDEDGRPDEAGLVGRHAAGPSDHDAPGGAGDEDGSGPGTPGTVRLRRYVVTEYVTEVVPGQQAGTGHARDEVIEPDADGSGRGTIHGKDDRR